MLRVSTITLPAQVTWASEPYILTVTSALVLPHAPVDSTFRSSLDQKPTVIVPEADGKMLVASSETFRVNGHDQTGIVRLNSDGSIDASFDVGQGTGSGGISQIFVQPDHRIVVVGSFSSIRGIACHGAARLNSDGSLDPSFTAIDSSFVAEVVPPFWIQLSGGGFVRVTHSTTTDFASVTRLSSNGVYVFGYVIDLVPAIGTAPKAGLSFDTVSSAMDDQGRIYVAVSEHVGKFSGGSRLIRLSPDGTIDPSFPTVAHGPIVRLWWIRGHVCYDSGSDLYDATYSGRYSQTFGKLTEAGAPDSSFTPVVLLNAPGTVPNPATNHAGTFDADGGVIVTAPFNGLIRYEPSGIRDQGFSATLDDGELLVTDLTSLDNGDLLVMGGFDSLNGVATRHLARLRPARDAYATRLSNFSTRSTAGTGDLTLITGFIVAGNGTKNLLVRGIGPTLAAFGVGNAVPDPVLNMYRLETFLSSNNDWSSSLIDVFTRIGAFALPRDSRDAALLASLTTGSYSAHVTPSSVAPASAPAVALVEIYDTDGEPTSGAQPRLVNISARTQVGTGENILIGGFIVSGPGTRRILIRAVGPGLSSYGVGSVLSDPQLTIYSGEVVIASNDNWDAEISPASARVYYATAEIGTFGLNRGSRDAALVLRLPAGVYSAQVSGSGYATGVALVEIYELPP